ncbi:respiratory chain complex I subunit 1 family protein [Hydrogenobaculum acidophilum]
MDKIIGILQLIIFISIAPGVKGFIHKLKLNLRGQKGPSILQPYKDIVKLFKKESVISKDASFISKIAPIIVLLALIINACFIPIFSPDTLLAFTGDVIAFIYILGLSTFFLALYGLDQGSAFGGLGSAREMTIASLAEPTLMMVMFTFSLEYNTSNISEIFIKSHSSSFNVPIPYAFSLLALFFVSMAENARIPFDNPETHLELTMVHEAMILEASGKYLAIFELSSYIKLLLFISIASNIFLPFFYSSNIFLNVLFYLIKVVLFSVPIAIVELSIAKFRFFRIPDLLMVSFALATLGFVLYYV